MHPISVQLQVSVSTMRCNMYLNPLRRFCSFVVDCSYVCNFVPNDYFRCFYHLEKEHNDLYCVKIGFIVIVVQYFAFQDPSATYEHC